MSFVINNPILDCKIWKANIINEVQRRFPYVSLAGYKISDSSKYVVEAIIWCINYYFIYQTNR